jgi:ABC-type amino acid transport system permease subunit
MTADAAALAVIIALMVGYYFARWRRAETSRKTNKAIADVAAGVAWRTRGTMLLVGAALWAIIDAWFRGKGR